MNKYEIIGIVGEGAYGIVYKAKCKETGEFGMFVHFHFLLKSLASLLAYLSSQVIFITHLNLTFKGGFLKSDQKLSISNLRQLLSFWLPRW